MDSIENEYTDLYLKDTDLSVSVFHRNTFNTVVDGNSSFSSQHDNRNK